MYFKNTLDKLGVQVEIEHAGKYKDFGDMFTRTSMTPETKEVLNSIIDDLYGNLVKRIAEARKRSPDEIRATIDQGPFLSPQAREKGLIDGLLYEDQMFDSSRCCGAWALTGISKASSCASTRPGVRFSPQTLSGAR
jgi:protease-4